MIINLKKEQHYKKAEFWLLKINDSNARKDTSNLFFFNRSQLAVKENKLEKARKFADKVSELQHQTTLYFRIAQTELEKNKDRFKTLELLDKVYKLARKSDDSVSKAQVYFGLAYMFAKVDTIRSFDSLSNAIKVVNKLENPDIFKTSILLQISTKEIKHFSSYNTVGLNMEKVFNSLAEKDFSLTLGYAQGFSDKYFRTLAVISTVRNCAETKSKIKN